MKPLTRHMENALRNWSAPEVSEMRPADLAVVVGLARRGLCEFQLGSDEDMVWYRLTIEGHKLRGRLLGLPERIEKAGRICTRGEK